MFRDYRYKDSFSFYGYFWIIILFFGGRKLRYMIIFSFLIFHFLQIPLFSQPFILQIQFLCLSSRPYFAQSKSVFFHSLTYHSPSFFFHLSRFNYQEIITIWCKVAGPKVGECFHAKFLEKSKDEEAKEKQRIGDEKVVLVGRWQLVNNPADRPSLPRCESGTRSSRASSSSSEKSSVGGALHMQISQHPLNGAIKWLRNKFCELN